MSRNSFTASGKCWSDSSSYICGKWSKTLEVNLNMKKEKNMFYKLCVTTNKTEGWRVWCISLKSIFSNVWIALKPSLFVFGDLKLTNNESDLDTQCPSVTLLHKNQAGVCKYLLGSVDFYYKGLDCMITHLLPKIPTVSVWVRVWKFILLSWRFLVGLPSLFQETGQLIKNEIKIYGKNNGGDEPKYPSSLWGTVWVSGHCHYWDDEKDNGGSHASNEIR